MISGRYQKLRKIAISFTRPLGEKNLPSSLVEVPQPRIVHCHDPSDRHELGSPGIESEVKQEEVMLSCISRRPQRVSAQLIS